MGASSDKVNVGEHSLQDTTHLDKNKKVRPHRPKKSRAVEEPPVAGSSTEHAQEDGSTWAWRSLTESSASKVNPVFTKDGRCANC